MQPVEAHKGFSTKSKLYDSLKVYLNNKDRLQPIIGLGSIIECVKAGTNYREALYLCEVCACRLSKADIRNHIMGSLHRYNYIKAWHPHLVSEWKENTNLSKLAWPLMEKAKILEGKEGPGDVQLLEVEDTIYQEMATCSENDAITLINGINGQGEPESHSEATSVQLEHNPIPSHRIVLLAKNQQKRSQKSFKTSAETNKAPSLIQSTVAPSVTSEGWLNDMSLLDNTQMLPETSVLSDNSNSFLDGYTGTKPLIGLFRVVECRSEDGHTYCFLCHCCRIRSNKKDIIDHLTSSSHLVNYLMETHPEQMEVLTADVDDNYQLLQYRAKKVEQEEGRGELKVVNAPESLCILLTGKSYHWCVKMLCNGWTHTNIQKRKIAVKVPSVTNQRMPEKCAAVLSNRTKRRTTKRKMRKMSNTVFKVSLPINKGSVLLKRTSFSVNSLPVSSAYSPPPEDDLIPSPESQSEDCELDCGTGSLAVNYAEHTSSVQQDFDSGDENKDAGQYVGPERNFDNHYQEKDGYLSHNEYLSQPETKDPRLYGENNYNGSESWSFYNSFYGHEEGCTEQWYNSTSQSKVGTSVDVSREEGQKEMSSGATQYDYQQQPQDQYTAQDDASLLTGSVGQHGFSGELAHVDAAWINMHPHLGYSLAHSGNITPGVQFPQVQQRPWPTYMGFIQFPSTGHVQTAPQRYMTQPTAHQALQVGHGVMSNPNCNLGPTTTPEQQFPHPSVIWNPR